MIRSGRSENRAYAEVAWIERKYFVVWTDNQKITKYNRHFVVIHLCLSIFFNFLYYFEVWNAQVERYTEKVLVPIQHFTQMIRLPFHRLLSGHLTKILVVVAAVLFQQTEPT